MLSMPRTLRKVSCCPANEASGRSSAVALERTAKLTSAPLSPLSPTSWSYAVRMSLSRSAGNACLSTCSRMLAPTSASLRVSSTSRSDSIALMRSARPSFARKRRYASAVVAKPSGTVTPALDRCWTISPREAFLPPTSSTSPSPRSANLITFSVTAGPSGRWCASCDWVVGLGRVHCGRPSAVAEASALHDDRRDLLDGHRGGVDDGDLVGAVHRLGAAQLVAALREARVARARTAFAAHLAQARGRGQQPEALGGIRP